MTRFHFNVAAILALLVLASGLPAFGQDLFEQQNAQREDAPMTAEQKAAGDKESIF